MTASPLAIAGPAPSPGRQARELNYARLLGGTLAGAAVAVVVNYAIYVVAGAIGVPFVGRFDPSAPATSLAAPMIAVASIVPAIVSALVLCALNALLRKPSRAYLPLAAAVLLVSFGGPLSLGEAILSTKASLALMHLGAAVPIVLLQLRLGRGQQHT